MPPCVPDRCDPVVDHVLDLGDEVTLLHVVRASGEHFPLPEPQKAQVGLADVGRS